MTAPTSSAGRFGSVRRHKNRWQARYLDTEGRAVARNWPTEATAWAWLAWAEPRRYRWPLDALQDIAEHPTLSGLARALNTDTTTVQRAAQRGLSDYQADRWAIALGFHPLIVWGWAWIDAALEVFPADTGHAEAVA